MSTSRRDRAAGALFGLAVGDALGMPTQYLSRETIARRYGVLDDFHPGPDDNPISAGRPAGRVTDDTDQAVILGELLVAGRGVVDPYAFADRLLDWERRMRAAGSLDLLGPSTLLALRLAADGVPVEQTGRTGDTDGAAMRIAPVGVAVLPDRLVDAVEHACLVTHHTHLAVAGASAVAAAVSSGVAGHRLADSLGHAVEAAREGGRRGFYTPGPDVAARIVWALDLVSGRTPGEALDVIDRLVGTSVATQEAVPAALAVASVHPDDAWAAARHAASLGGDCDTIAAMCGAVVGAHTGRSSFPPRVPARLAAANPDLNLDRLTDDLLALRGPESSHA